jgi:hypothetical protein
MKHPAPEQLALFSGGDLGRWERWRISRHSARCPECRREIQAVRDASGELRQLASESPVLPNALNWNRLAEDRLVEEITANIRLGLAAGEAIASFDKPLRAPSGLRRLHISNAALVAAGAAAIFAVAFWTSLPPQQADHLLASLNRIRTERIGAWIHSAPAGGAHERGSPQDVVIEASSSGIQVRENGRALSLIPRSDGATVSVDMHGSAGVRYVDADTGQVTTTKVYYAQQ